MVLPDWYNSNTCNKFNGHGCREPGQAQGQIFSRFLHPDSYRDSGDMKGKGEAPIPLSWPVGAPSQVFLFPLLAPWGWGCTAWASEWSSNQLCVCSALLGHGCQAGPGDRQARGLPCPHLVMGTLACPHLSPFCPLPAAPARPPSRLEALETL